MNFNVSKKDFCPNGCGPKSKKLYVRIASFFVPNLIFKACCNQHDINYFVGGCKEVSNKTRYLADKEFLKHMLSECDKVNIFLKHSYKVAAYIYFKAVRRGGEDSFNWFSNKEDFFKHLKEHDITFINQHGARVSGYDYFMKLYELKKKRLAITG